MVEPIFNWRHEAGLTKKIIYKKKFALTRILCSDGSDVWLKNYYKKYEIWSDSEIEEYRYRHTDFIENVTEAEYIIRKLADNL